LSSLSERVVEFSCLFDGASTDPVGSTTPEENKEGGKRSSPPEDGLDNYDEESPTKKNKAEAAIVEAV